MKGGENIMNIKKIFVLLLFVIAIVGIIAPVEAKLVVNLDPYTANPINGKTKISWHVYSDIGYGTLKFNSANAVSKRKAELNKVNKVVDSIKGYETVTHKKPAKGWNIQNNFAVYKVFSVKGNPNGKNYSIKFYDKRNKLIKSEKGKVTYYREDAGNEGEED